MKVYKAENIRNVALISHVGAGKTSLIDAALFDSGAVTRQGKVDEGSSISDYDPDELKRRMSLIAKVLPVEWKNTKINFIDTPGYADFLGEVKAAGLVAPTRVRRAQQNSPAVAGIDGKILGIEQRFGGIDLLPRFRFVFGTIEANPFGHERLAGGGPPGADDGEKRAITVENHPIDAQVVRMAQTGFFERPDLAVVAGLEDAFFKYRGIERAGVLRTGGIEHDGSDRFERKSFGLASP